MIPFVPSRVLIDRDQELQILFDRDAEGIDLGKARSTRSRMRLRARAPHLLFSQAAPDRAISIARLAARSRPLGEISSVAANPQHPSAITRIPTPMLSYVATLCQVWRFWS